MENAFAYEAEQRWPDNFAQSEARLSKLSASQRGDLIEVGNEITRRLAKSFVAGVAADSPAVQEEIAHHYEWVCNFWTPMQESYIGLGEMYVEDGRFTAHYDEFAVGLAAFLRDAMQVYALTELGVEPQV